MAFAAITSLGRRVASKFGSGNASRVTGKAAGKSGGIFAKVRGFYSRKPQTSALQTGISPQAKLGLLDAPAVSTASAAKPAKTIYMDSKGVGHTKPSRPWEDINTIFDNETKQFKPLSAKKSEKLRRKAGGSPQAAPLGTKPGAKPDGSEDGEGGFWSNGWVTTIGGTLVGELAVSALISMISGGGGSAEAAVAPAEASSASASSYDPYASSGSYGIPGSIPNYI